MKLTVELNLVNQGNQCQFGIEADLDDNAEMDEIQEKTNKATAALKIAVNSVINIKALEYASLTDIISQAWSGMTTRQYKALKGLHKENLRDNMSNMELILNMLAEATTTELSKKKNPQGFKASAEAAKQGRAIAGNTRKQIENETGTSICTSERSSNILDTSEEEK